VLHATKEIQTEVKKLKTQVCILKTIPSKDQLKPLDNNELSFPQKNIRTNNINLSLQSISKVTTQKWYCLVNFKVEDFSFKRSFPY